MPSPSDDLRGRAFLNPPKEPPFWQSKPFQIFVVLAVLALAVPLVLLRDAGAPADGAGARTPEDPSTPALPKTADLTPEERADREAYLATAFEGALRDQADGTELADTGGSRKLIEVVARYDPADFTARTQRTLDYASATADPDAWRGEFVRIYGVLGEVWPEKLARPVLGRTTVWRAQLATGDNFTEPNLVQFLDRPMPELTLGDLRLRAAEIEGIFYRTGTFESEYENGKGQRVEATWTIPWVFARNIRLIDEGQSPTRTLLHDHPMLAFAVLAFVIFGGRLLFSWIHSRRRVQRRAQTAPGIREMFERKLREKGISPPPPSSMPPPPASPNP